MTILVVAAVRDWLVADSRSTAEGTKVAVSTASGHQEKVTTPCHRQSRHAFFFKPLDNHGLLAPTPCWGHNGPASMCGDTHSASPLPCVFGVIV